MSSTPSPENSPYRDEVDDGLIASLEAEQPSTDVLYGRLYDAAPQIALWMRRRAAELHPELTERGSEAQLALELAQLCLDHLTKGPPEIAEREMLENLYLMDAHQPPAA